MRSKSTTVKSIMEVIKNKMVKVTEVELYHKNSHKVEIIQPNVFVNELKSLSCLSLFREAIDFEYELICNGELIDNEKIQILCGHNNYGFPYCINAILKLDTSICESVEKLEHTLRSK